MSNPKIEKVNVAIAKTKATISEYTKKLRELERQKTDLENLDIIALFRRENISQDEFAALIHSQRKPEPEETENAAHAANEKKEDKKDAILEN